MREWLARHRFVVTVATLLVLPLLVMYWHGRREGGTSAVERLSTGLAGLAQSGVQAMVETAAETLHDYVLLVDVQEENRRLRDENEQLVGEALDAKRYAVENQALRRLLELKRSRREWSMAPASVVGRELTPFYRVSRMSVDVEGDGELARDLAVVTREGLVGRVVRTSGRLADVMLLTDSRSRVAVEVLGRGVLGMLVGTGLADEYQARLQVSVNEAPLGADAAVITSGHDRVFPRGIEVGYVADPAKRRQAGAFVEYDVILAVNPATVQEALVVTGSSATGAPET